MRSIARAGLAPAVLGIAFSSGVAHAQTPAMTGSPLLGRAHLWAKIGRMNLSDAAAGEWGVDRDSYLGLELCGGGRQGFYWGAEIGRIAAGQTVTADGDTIRNFDLYWLELNTKKSFDLRHSLSIAPGFGLAFFYVDGTEVPMTGIVGPSRPLASFGTGGQVFVDLTWRRDRLLLGIDAKYQAAVDFVGINYSNVRLGVHLGAVF